jgi:hypothetical protein
VGGGGGWAIFSCIFFLSGKDVQEFFFAMIRLQDIFFFEYLSWGGGGGVVGEIYLKFELQYSKFT